MTTKTTIRPMSEHEYVRQLNAICRNFARQYIFGEGRALIDDTKARLADLDVAHGARRDVARRGAERRVHGLLAEYGPKFINKYHRAKTRPAPSQDTTKVAALGRAYTLDIAWAVQTTVTVTALTLEDAHAQARAMKYTPKVMPSVPRIVRTTAVDGKPVDLRHDNFNDLWQGDEY